MTDAACVCINKCTYIHAENREKDFELKIYENLKHIHNIQDWYSFLVVAVMPENVINGTDEEKIKTTVRLKGGRVTVEDENALKDIGNWSNIKYISVEKVGEK